jgi:hypothetical protein
MLTKVITLQKCDALVKDLASSTKWKIQVLYLQPI